MDAFTSTVLSTAAGTASIALGIILGLLVVALALVLAFLAGYVVWLAWHIFRRWRAYRRAYWDRHDPGRPKWRNNP